MVVSHDGVCQTGIIPDRPFNEFAAKHHLYHLSQKRARFVIMCKHC